TYYLLGFFFFYFAVQSSRAQSEMEYFNKAARQYVNSDIPGTGQILAEGLEKYRNDPKLLALNEKLKQEQEQQKKDQQNQEQQEQQEQQDKEKQENQQQKDGEGEEQTQED